MNTYFFLPFSSLPSWLCSAQLGWRLLGWGQGNSLRQAQCDMFWLFTYTLIQVLIMFVLSARIKSAGKSEKHETEFIRSHHYHSGNKKKHCSHTHARLYTHTHTHPSSTKDKCIIHAQYTLNTNWCNWKASLQLSYPDAALLRNICWHTHNCYHIHFICSTAGLWMPIHKHWFTLRFALIHFIYLFIHSLIHFMSKTCQLPWLSSGNWIM